MAPEQTGGKGAVIGPAADVHSLGAILYHVLTGRPPFQGETALDALHQLCFLDPIPPRHLRPGVPRDLETVCLKCLEKDPGSRYQTARALADDLERCRDGKPPLARPVGLLGRAVRWSRRKPVIAGLLAALLLVLPTGLGGMLWQWRRAEQMAATLRRENERMVQERGRADRHIWQGRQLVKELTQAAIQLGMHPLQDGQETGHTSHALIDRALTFYRAILADKSTDPVVRLETAQAGLLAGWYGFGFGLYPKADEAYRASIRLLEGLLADDPDNPTYLRELCLGHVRRGHLLRDTGRTADARKAYAEALAIGERLVKLSGKVESRVLLANVLTNSTTVLGEAEHAGQRLERMRRALDLTSSAADAFPANGWFQEEKALCLEGLAQLGGSNSQPEAAEKLVREALVIRAKLVEKGHQGPPFARYLARSHTILGRMLGRDRPAEAEREFQSSIALLKKLVTGYPTGPYIRVDLADAQFALAELLAGSPERWADVEELNREGLAHYERLAAALPKQPYYTNRLVQRSNRLAFLLVERGRYDDAIELYRKALQRRPGDPATNNSLAWALATHTDPKRREPAEALRLARKAVAAAPKDANFLNTLGAAQYRAGAWKDAMSSLQAAVRLRGEEDAFDEFFLAMSYWRLGARDQARQWYEKAEQCRQKKQPSDPELPRLRAEAEALLAQPSRP
jgi:tetratricopeptide (TPR) repeat protein